MNCGEASEAATKRSRPTPKDNCKYFVPEDFVTLNNFMRNFGIFLCIFFSGFVSYAAQTIFQSATGRVRRAEEVEVMREIYRRRDEQRRIDFLRQIAESNRVDFSNTPDRVVITLFPKELQTRARKYLDPPVELKNKFQGVLHDSPSGIVRLSSGAACVSDKDDIHKGIDKLIAKCPFSFIPGNGLTFSFRQKYYSSSSLADLGISGNWVYSLGLLNNTIMVNLGDLPISDARIDSPGMKVLTGFIPSTQIESADVQRNHFEMGVEDDKRLYRQVLPLEFDKTFALRVVAYNNPEWSTTVNTPVGARTVSPFKGDRRDDIIVVFRLLESKSDNSVIMIWKELKRSLAPSMVIPKS